MGRRERSADDASTPPARGGRPHRTRATDRASPIPRTPRFPHLLAVLVSLFLLLAVGSPLLSAQEPQDLTAPARPAPPGNLTAAAGPGPSNITLDWDRPPSEDGVFVTEYRVYRHNGSGSGAGNASRIATVAASTTTYTDSGLPNDARRVYHVRAVWAAQSPDPGLGTGDVGESPPSNEADAVTFTVPTAPLDPTAVPGPGPGEVTLSWTAPADDGGLNVTAYRVLAEDDEGNLTVVAVVDGAPTEDNGTADNDTADNGTSNDTAAPVPPTTFTVTDLDDNRTVRFRVAADNPAGTGPASTTVEATTFDVPGPVRDLSAGPGPGAGTITLQWMAPTDDGGTPVTAYVVQAGPSADALDPLTTLDAAGAAGILHTEGNLTAGQHRVYAVAAVNLVGNGSAVLANATAYAVPGPVRDLAAEPGPRTGEITLTWTAPPDDGGLPIENYTVLRGSGPEDLVPVATMTPGTSSYTDTGLPEDGRWTYAVRAETDAGPGALNGTVAAAPLAPEPEPTAPGPVTDASATAGPGPDEVTLTWAPPAADDGGAPLLGYRIYRTLVDGADEPSEDPELVADLDPDTLELVDADLSPGATYAYHVVAFNAAGETELGDPLQVSVPAATDAGAAAGDTAGGTAASGTSDAGADTQGAPVAIVAGGLGLALGLLLVVLAVAAVRHRDVRPWAASTLDRARGVPGVGALLGTLRGPGGARRGAARPGPARDVVLVAADGTESVLTLGGTAGNGGPSRPKLRTDAMRARGPDGGPDAGPASTDDPARPEDPAPEGTPTPGSTMSEDEDPRSHGPRRTDLRARLGVVPFELDPFDPRDAAVDHLRSARADLDAAARTAAADGGPFAKAAARALRRRADALDDVAVLDDHGRGDAASPDQDPWTVLEAARAAARTAGKHRARADLLVAWSADADRAIRTDTDDAADVETLADRWEDLLARRLATGPVDEDDGTWLVTRLRTHLGTRTAVDRARDALSRVASAAASDADDVDRAIPALDDVLCTWARDAAAQDPSMEPPEHDPDPTAPAAWTGSYADPAEGPAHALADLLDAVHELLTARSDKRARAGASILACAADLDHPGLLAPHLTALAEDALDADRVRDADLDRLDATLDRVLARERMVLDLELPRRLGLSLGPDTGPALVDRAAAVASRHPRQASADALAAYLAGKSDEATTGASDAATSTTDEALLASAADALTRALSADGGEAGFDAVLARAVGRELDRRRVASVDHLVRDLVGPHAQARDRVVASVRALVRQRRAVLDEATGLVARPFDAAPAPEDLHRLRRRLAQLTGGDPDASARLLDLLLDGPARAPTSDPSFSSSTDASSAGSPIGSSDPAADGRGDAP